MDKVFKALADPTRRYLLDQLHAENGQTLGELAERVAMTRQSATQHLALLEAANLVSTVRRGREKLHYLNPVPLHEIQERWIDKFEHPRLRALSALKQQAEATMTTNPTNPAKPTYVYVTYIESTPEKVWHALTDAELTAAYWGHANVSDWRQGSPWEHRRTDGSGIADVVGEVVESTPPTRLVTTWGYPNAAADSADPSQVTFDIEPYGGIVRLTVTHENLADEKERNDVGSGWPAVLSNLKSLLETGSPLPDKPWLVPSS
ncbi:MULTISPECIES: ArsR/SmtB family transcription factor [unclassified Streptomyces]|uniref:ArsR/SmtB family transcription factor n=1 Tax=unclassified Streptomyces TaxID=2593676 RepID=UPI00332440A8